MSFSIYWFSLKIVIKIAETCRNVCVVMENCNLLVVDLHIQNTKIYSLRSHMEKLVYVTSLHHY
jgi:hypothetical protein